MSHIAYHQAADGTHVIDILSEFSGAEAQEVIDILAEIAVNARTTPAYCMIDMRGHYVLPLREFSAQLKRLYREMPENQPLFVAMVVDASVISVLSTIVKTLVRRESIQYFVEPDKAYMWLGIERTKQSKKLA
jgi:hypothetical protein